MAYGKTDSGPLNMSNNLTACVYVKDGFQEGQLSMNLP